MDFSAFAASNLPLAGEVSLRVVDGQAYDQDNLLIPPVWLQPEAPSWSLMPKGKRIMLSHQYEIRLLITQPKATPAKRPGTKKFSTDYAIKWGQNQGWKLVDRERYDVRTQRHHDLQLGMDALMDDGKGLIGIQGAGKSQRKEHWDRFTARGGVDVAQRRSIRVVYVEFVREDKAPIKLEWWA